MTLQSKAQAAARLAVVDAKSEQALDKVLGAWFTTHFIKSAKLESLRGIHNANSYTAFAQLLEAAPDADRIALLKKVDKHNTSCLAQPKHNMMAHIASLAAGTSEPTPKPRPVRAATQAKPKGKKQVGIITETKY